MPRSLMEGLFHALAMRNSAPGADRKGRAIAYAPLGIEMFHLLRQTEMLKGSKLQQVQVLLIAGALSLPVFALASENLENRVSTLEIRIKELSEKVDTLTAGMQKPTSGKSLINPDLSSAGIVYDSSGQAKTTGFWPDFWSNRQDSGN